MCSALSRSCTVLVNLSVTALEGSQAFRCLSGNFKRMYCPVKSVLRPFGNSLNLSYVFIVYCRQISAWQFVTFLGSCKLNGSLKNSIPYIFLYLFEKGSAIMFVPECTTRYAHSLILEFILL